MRKWFQTITFKMISLISVLIIFICGTFLYLLQDHIRDMTEDQVATRALNIASTIASMTEITDAFSSADPSAVIQPIAMEIQKEIGAAFIVIGNKEGIRYSHPDPEKIGMQMVGGDNDAALLDGKSYVSKTKGSLGLSIRGKVPIIKDDEIIGVVSVGFLAENIDHMIQVSFKKWLAYASLLFSLGIAGAFLISFYIKRLLFNMEPLQIAKLYQQHKMILETTEEGILAVGPDSHITTINASAYEMIDPHKSTPLSDWMGLDIKHIFTQEIARQDTIRNLELSLDDSIVILNKAPLLEKNKRIGSLYTMRKKTDIQKIAEELKQAKQRANMQRAQTHEYANKLHIILGLLVHKKYGEAIHFIKREKNIQGQAKKILNSNSKNPLLFALIQGKITEAAELGITMELKECTLSTALNDKQEDALLTALGNVLQNAIEAVRSSDHPSKAIQITIDEYKDRILFEIQDSGNGVSEELYTTLFTRGISTKGGTDRGHGLAISRQALQSVGGEILLDEGDLPGACFLIILPKQEERP
ncbi:MAG: ATP-binding protein [Lysinibacillus sp.]